MSRQAPTVADFAGAWSRTLPSALAQVVIDRVPSTQRLARRLLARHAEEGETPGPMAIIALEQSAGKGRRERAWLSGHGLGAWLTVALRQPLAALQGVPMRAALAAADAVQATSGVDCRLKWPNDLVVRGYKLGGLLVDVTSRGEHDAWAVIGVGVNLDHRAEQLPTPTSTSIRLCVGDEARIPRLEVLVEALVGRLWGALVDDRDEAGGSWRTRYAERSAHRLGDLLTCELAEGTVTGRFAGFEEHGFLRLTTADGERVIHTGEVFAW